MQNTKNTNFDLTGKTALVAGASKGIGYAITTGFVDAGADVFGIGRTVIDTTKFKYRICDVRSENDFETVCKEAKKIDIFVFACGITHPFKINQTEQQKASDFINVFLTNLYSSYTSILSVLNYMPDGGSIINITSIGAEFGFPNNPPYVSSKGGLKMLTKALAVDLGKRKIRVNNIAPGYIRTDMTMASYKDKTKNKTRQEHTILDRWGEPNDLVGPAIFLASDASAYVTGIDLFVDGGWSAKGMVGE